jgi:acyl-CoA reductase-like NAD-dependent aldehyde dehydrogenase
MGVERETPLNVSASSGSDGFRAALRRAGLPECPAQARAGEFSVVHPGNDSLVGALPSADAAAVDAAVARARHTLAQGAWIGVSPAERAAALRRFADAVESHGDELALRDTLDMGRPLSHTTRDPGIAAGYLRGAAELAATGASGDLWEGSGGAYALNVRVPLGVVAAISAWNYPLIVAVTKIAAPLAAGNCVILKPSELAPHSSLLLAEIARAAGIPSGVLTVITGNGATGALLATHSEVQSVTFTGSTATGRAVMKAAASNLKRVVLECGGKSPHLVFADAADLRYVAERIAAGILENSGQLCTAGSRVIIERSAHRNFAELLREALAPHRPGDPLAERTRLGPLVSAAAGRRVCGAIRQAQRDGARNLLPRTPSDAPEAYVHPAVLDNVGGTSAIFREETFGPVLCITEFTGEDEAVALANATPYGLVSTIWTTDRRRAFGLRRRLECGCTVLRSGDAGEVAVAEPPWEPARQSGFGVEAGPGSLQTFQRTAAVLVQMP